MSRILVVGEALVDVVRPAAGGSSEHPGGSPANVAFGLARLGRPTDLLTRLGDDGRGRAVRAHLEGAGVVLVPGSVAPGRTSTATALLDGAGVASYEFELDWAPQRAAVDAALAAAPVAVHTGSIAAFLPPGGDVVLELVQRLAGRALVSYDPNARPRLMGDPAAARARVERFVRAAHVVKVSDEDLAWLAPGADPLDVAAGWLDLGPALVVVTRGGAGASGLVAGRRVDVAAPPVTVADTVGAGDAFMSGLLDGLAGAGLLAVDRRPELSALSAGDLTDLLRHAVRVAAFTCTRPGAQPPTRAELTAWTTPAAG